MLRYLDMNEIADRIAAAVEKITTAGEGRTRDLGGTTTTTEFTDAIIGAL